jgi:hypothetical protein
MEETRIYPIDEDESWLATDDERSYEALKSVRDDEVPFHIPRD